MSSIAYSHLPILPDVLYRHLQADEDAPRYVALYQACQNVDQIDPHSTREYLPSLADARREFTDIEPDTMLVALAHGKMIAYIRFFSWTESGDVRVYLHLGRVVPSWRGQGLGTGLLHWVEERIRLQAKTELSKAASWLYTANASETETSATELLLHTSYTMRGGMVEMELTDLAALPKLTVPAGFTLRTLTPDQYLPLWNAQHEHFWADQLVFGNPVADENAYQAYLQAFSQPDFDPSLWYILWNAEHPVATVQTHINGAYGIVDEASVHVAFRRQGLGRFLMLEAAYELKLRGATYIRLFRNVTNLRAEAFYLSLGFRNLKRFSFYRKDGQVKL